MFSLSWRKIRRDLWLNLPRTILVVLAIAIGIFGVGFVLDANSLLAREIDANYKMAEPPSATLWLDRADAGAVKIARSFPGIAGAEAARSRVRARVQVGPNEWDVLALYVVEDFNDLRISKFFPESGSWPPVDRQILLERASMPVVKGAIGKTITVKALGGSVHEITVAGSVFDPNQDPAWVNNIATGYVTPETLKWLGGSAPEQGLNIIVRENNLDRSHIQDVAERLSSVLRQDGYLVKRAEVPLPGKFQQTNKINSLLYTLIAFGLLCLVLSGFMTATLISALLSEQIRQICVMMALGARRRRIAMIYLGMVMSLALVALAISMPLAAIAGQSFMLSTMKMLNFNVTNSSIPIWAYAAQVALGILAPLLTAVYPICRGSRITVREAFNDFGFDQKNFGTGRIDVLLERVRGLPRPLALSLRNAFRRRGRLILTLVMLSVGGASFIASLAATASWDRTIDNSFANINYDIDIRFGKTYSIDAIEKSIRTIPGVTGVEAWGYNMSGAFPKYSDGTYGGPYVVFAPQKGSTLINPPVAEGRWLRADDTNAIVLDTEFIDNAEKLGTPVKVGDDFTLNLNGRDTVWHVVGIMDKIGLQSAAYVNYDYFAQISNQKGLAMSALVSVTGHDKTLQKTVTRALEQKLAEDGMSVFAIQGLAISRQVMINHVVLIVFLLMLMSLLVAAVGALGLASTMSVNVMERTREIGIMRSVGASTRIIIQVIITEGVVAGILSWLLGSSISIPLTNFIARNTGQFIFPHIMAMAYPLWAPLLWLGTVILISVAASFYPAWKATRLTVREVLTYE